MTHPIYVDDVSLEGYRDRLIWLVEGTWPDVGLMLLRAKKSEDMCYPSIWGDQRNSLPVVGALLRSPEQACRTDANDLYKKRKEIDAIGDEIRDAYEVEKQCRENLEKVEAALGTALTADQELLLIEKRNERLEALIKATAQRTILDNRRRKADAILKNCETQFARSELMKFIKARRYTKNPFNTTNALAGLPFIGWRQSVKRCQKWECQTGGLATDLLKVVTRIVESWNPKATLKVHARGWLEQNSQYKPGAQTELRREFFYLRRAIDEVLKSTPRRKFLPYLITNEYQRRVSNRSPVDQLFEAEEQVVPKARKAKSPMPENSQ